jgi:hypothetical protein
VRSSAGSGWLPSACPSQPPRSTGATITIVSPPDPDSNGSSAHRRRASCCPRGRRRTEPTARPNLGWCRPVRPTRQVPCHQPPAACRSHQRRPRPTTPPPNTDQAVAFVTSEIRERNEPGRVPTRTSEWRGSTRRLAPPKSPAPTTLDDRYVVVQTSAQRRSVMPIRQLVSGGSRANVTDDPALGASDALGGRGVAFQSSRRTFVSSTSGRPLGASHGHVLAAPAH